MCLQPLDHVKGGSAAPVLSVYHDNVNAYGSVLSS